MRLDGGAVGECPRDVREHARGMSEFRAGEVICAWSWEEVVVESMVRSCSRERGRRDDACSVRAHGGRSSKIVR